MHIDKNLMQKGTEIISNQSKKVGAIKERLQSSGSAKAKPISERERQAQLRRASENEVSRNFDSYGFDTAAFAPVTPVISRDDAGYDSYGFEEDKKSRGASFDGSATALGSNCLGATREGEMEAMETSAAEEAATATALKTAAGATEQLDIKGHAEAAVNAADEAGQESLQDNEEKEPRPERNRKTGRFLIILGASLVVLAAAIFAVSSLAPSGGSVSWAKADQYLVPDGILQGQDVGSDTYVKISYDLEDNMQPYAVEYHAVASYDGLFPSEKDLYSFYCDNANGGGSSESFADVVRSSGDLQVPEDVVNFRMIDIHLPRDAEF